MAMRPAEARILLGLRGEPSEEELLTAYRAMLRAWHPDRFTQGSDLLEVSNQRTRSIIEAFAVLQDELTARKGVGRSPQGTRALADDAKRPRDPLRFDGPTPEKADRRADSSTSPVRSRRWAAVALLAVVLSGAGVVALARGGAPVEGAVLPSAQAAGDVELPALVEAERESEVPNSGFVSDNTEAPVTASIATYSVAIGAFRDRNRAMTVVRQLTQQAPGVWTTTVPVRVGETVFHRILVGFADDQKLLEQVVETVGPVLEEDPRQWILREAGLTLCLSDGDSLQEARRLVTGLNQRGISSFALKVPLSEGEAGIRVCSGSFDGPSEADYLRQALIREGFDPSLEPRLGEPVL